MAPNAARPWLINASASNLNSPKKKFFYMASFENQRIGAMSVQYMPYVEDKDRSQFEQLVSVGPASRFGDLEGRISYIRCMGSQPLA